MLPEPYRPDHAEIMKRLSRGFWTEPIGVTMSGSQKVYRFMSVVTYDQRVRSLDFHGLYDGKLAGPMMPMPSEELKAKLSLPLDALQRAIEVVRLPEQIWCKDRYDRSYDQSARATILDMYWRTPLIDREAFFEEEQVRRRVPDGGALKQIVGGRTSPYFISKAELASLDARLKQRYYPSIL